MFFRLCLLLFILLLPISSLANDTEDQLNSFLENRVLLDQVYFGLSTAQLTLNTREKLDLLVPVLKEKAADDVLFRVEGFSSIEGDTRDNISLSMSRALAVKNYLREIHGLRIDVFMTGFGATGTVAAKGESRRVDIAMYNLPNAVKALFDDYVTVEKIIIK